MQLEKYIDWFLTRTTQTYKALQEYYGDAIDYIYKKIETDRDNNKSTYHNTKDTELRVAMTIRASVEH